MSDRRSKWDDGESAATSAKPQASDAAAAAAAAAAKISAQLSAAAAAASGRPSSGTPDRGPGNEAGTSAEKRRERDPHDGDFVHDLEINDIRNRYLLTKAQTQKQIHDDTGASVTTKGLWYPDKALAPTGPTAEPPLYLHISAMTKESLDKAIEQVNEIINSEMPQLIEDRHAKRLEYEQRSRAGPPQRREWVEEKVLIGLETLRNFNVRAKIVGPQGLFVKYIQNETGTRVQIKGQGSGFIETQTGYEAPEPMFVSISGPEAAKVAEAKELAVDLIDAVKTEHGKAQHVLMQQWGGPPAGPGGGFQGHQQGGYQGGYGGPAAGGPGPGGHQAQQPGYDPAAPGQYPYSQQQQQPPQPQGAAPPLPNEHQPPPPPEDDAPPPPPPPAAALAPTLRKKTPEEEALDKYWADYIEWEKSFKAYHGRAPSAAEGLQDAPAEYRRS